LQGQYDDDPRPRSEFHYHHQSEQSLMSSGKRPWSAKQRQSQQSQTQSQRHFYNWELSHSLGAPQHQMPPYLMQSTGRKAAQNDYGRLLF